MSPEAPERTDAVLFLSPCSLALTFPELGIPQLAGYLRARGRSVRALDLNALFLGEFLKSPGARGLLRARLAARKIRPAPPANFAGTPWGPKRLEGDSAAAAAWSDLLAIKAGSWEIGEVARASAEHDWLYDLFFERYVAPAAAGAALAGFSVLTHHQVLPALYLSRRLKERYPGLKVCLGGPWCTASMGAVEDWPELFDAADAVVFYSGEEPLAGLLDWARGRRRLAGIPGLAWREGGRVRRTAVRPGPALEKLPPPDFTGFDLGLYPRRTLPYQTASGCEWGRCTFCYHCLPDNRFRVKPPALVARHLAVLKRRWGVGSFWLADLTAPEEMLDGLSRELTRRGLELEWTAMTRAGKRWTPEFAARLAASGCREAYFGLETADKEGLRRINKGLTPELFARSVRACAGAGIRVSVFLLKYPGQGEGEFRRTLEYVRGLRGAVSAIVVSDFELGRASNAMGRLGEFGITLPPGSGRDIRSFSLPYRAPLRADWRLDRLGIEREFEGPVPPPVRRRRFTSGRDKKK